jgi:geranylgeranyl pyrophosphate synthase
VTTSSRPHPALTSPATAPLETPLHHIEGLAEAIRRGKPLPPADAAVLERYASAAEDAGDLGGVADIVVAAELVDRGFRLHRLESDAGCRRDELLLGDYSLVCAAELATRLGRPDVDREFARAAMTAANGGDYAPHLLQAVATAVAGPDGARPATSTIPAVNPGEELAAIDSHMRALVARDPKLVREPMSRLLGAGGKRLRSVLAFLCSRLGSDHDPERAARLATLVEFIHNATLVHDDLVDESPLRRGLPAIHLAYAPEVAVRVGDFYFGRAAELLASLDNHRATRLVVEAVADVCQAQIEEFMQRGQDHIDEAGYLKIVEGKTAALFAGACAAGAAIGGASDEVIEAMHAYGHDLGVAFQMIDDVLDFASTSGKTMAQDLRQSVASLPLVYATEDEAVRARLAVLMEAEEFDAEAAVALVTDAGGLDRALARARDYRDAAIADLNPLPAGEIRDRLSGYAEFAIERRS